MCQIPYARSVDRCPAVSGREPSTWNVKFNLQASLNGAFLGSGELKTFADMSRSEDESQIIWAFHPRGSFCYFFLGKSKGKIWFAQKALMVFAKNYQNH